VDNLIWWLNCISDFCTSGLKASGHRADAFHVATPRNLILILPLAGWQGRQSRWTKADFSFSWNHDCREAKYSALPCPALPCPALPCPALFPLVNFYPMQKSFQFPFDLADTRAIVMWGAEVEK
jgi:hypothetical protein